MPKLDPESAVALLEIQQLIIEWGRVLDFDGGTGVSALCTQACEYHVGGTIHHGHAAIDHFYAARNERVRTQQKDGIRTQRHTITNIRVRFRTDGSAETTFTLVNYSDEGPPPVRNVVGPTIIADCRMEFTREGREEWRIALFDSTPIFIGNDPFLNAAVVKK